MKKCRPFLIPLFWVAFTALPASSQELHPCQADAQKFCADAKNVHERFHCLKVHSKELSPTCHESLANMRAKGRAFQTNCRADAAKFCAGLKERPLGECLSSNKGSLSPGCQKMVTNMENSRREFTERIPADCKPDVERLCQNVTPGEGRLVGCLEKSQGQLTDSCRKALDEDRKTPQHE